MYGLAKHTAIHFLEVRGTDVQKILFILNVS